MIRLRPDCVLTASRTGTHVTASASPVYTGTQSQCPHCVHLTASHPLTGATR
jgi:hypothetical protein